MLFHVHVFQLLMQLTLAWNAAPGSISGYRLHYGTAPAMYTYQIDVGSTTMTNVPNLTAGVQYFFAVTSYDINGVESSFSNEITYTPALQPTPTPGGPTATISPSPVPTVSPTPGSGPSITSLTVVGNPTGQVLISPLINGTVINLSLLGADINVEAKASAGVTGIDFALDSSYFHSEATSPYGMCGDWTTCPQNTITRLGNHTLLVVAKNAAGDLGPSISVTFQVVTSSTPTPAPVSPTPSISPLPTRTPSPAPSRSPTPMPSASPSATATVSPSPTRTASPSPSPTRTPTATPSPSPSPSLTPTPSATVAPTPSPTATISPAQTPSPTVSPTVTIGGTILYCGTQNPAPGVTVTLTGSVTGTTVTDAGGAFSFSVPSGAVYLVSPSKTALTAGSPAISTVDALGTMRYYLSKTGLVCPDAGEINGDGSINSLDVVGIQRFALGFASGGCGEYRFVPLVPTLDFSAILIGDVQ